MPRYIDIDKAIPLMIQACVDIVGHGITQVDAVRIAEILEDASTDDVVEVAREIFAELETKAPFFCENQVAYEHFNEELAELKKKYIGEKE